MNDPGALPNPLPLDEYLDGTLPAADQSRLSAEIAARPDLQSMIDLQTRIDESLRQSHLPPPMPVDLLSRLQDTVAPRPVPKPDKAKTNRFTLALAATAVAAIWGFLSWQFFFSSNRTAPSPPYPTPPLATVYKDTVARGFQPDWVCKDDHQFADTFFRRHGQGLLLAALPDGTKMEGLAYSRGLSANATTMLARVDETPVMVFVDRADCSSPPSPAPETGLQLFRKDLGSLVLYELTPLDHPAVMQYLYLADVPPQK